MRRKNNFDSFSERIIFLNREIELRGKLNLNDLSVHSEDFYIKLFNKLLELDLENLNTEKSNAEAIDLIDSNKKLIIQVSATCTKQKIENTLKKESLKSYAEQQYKIQFIFIGAQNNRIKKNTFLDPHQIGFMPQKNIFLTEDILRTFNTLDIPIQEDILELINLELPEIVFSNNKKLKEDICIEISQLLNENKLIWENFGPNSKMAKINPLEQTTFNLWNSRKKEIFANNDRILELFYQHENLFTLSERNTFTDFKEHAFSFATNDTIRIDRTLYKVFPQHFTELINRILEEKEG
ncbi:SMEK domain-containing protein [Enterococcus gallinarum]|uniref:SMEK domain-containing protein n=1 Tax=Enterococcus gallinarum TaxID=1353 RepID=UPI0032E39F10